MALVWGVNSMLVRPWGLVICIEFSKSRPDNDVAATGREVAFLDVKYHIIDMASVLLTAEARMAFDALRPPMRGRVAAMIERLANWPHVSGAKPLRGEMAGSCRVRTGDYRLVFCVRMDVVTVTRIALRRDVYED